MHLPSVKLFLEVSEAGSISKVAARRHTVQSHISRQISEFEASLGGPLLRRTGRGVTLTPLGARAALRLRSWLQETEQLQETLRADAGQLWGEVRLGIVPSAAHPLMPHVFDWLQREHPGIRLNITEAQVLALIERVRAERGMTVLLVTNEAGVARSADRALHLLDGYVQEVEGLQGYSRRSASTGVSRTARQVG